MCMCIYIYIYIYIFETNPIVIQVGKINRQYLNMDEIFHHYS